MILKGYRFGMILQIAVGPICLFIFQTAVSYGFSTALVGVLGITLIDTLYILAAIFGIGSMINKHKKFKITLNYFGALIIIIFGISNILEIFDFSLIPSLSIYRHKIESVFLKTLIMTLSNPLTLLFWSGVFSIKISEENLKKKDMYYFGIGAVLSTLTFLTVISITGSFLNHFIDLIVLGVLNFIVGLVLIAFGIKTVVKGSR